MDAAHSVETARNSCQQVFECGAEVFRSASKTKPWRAISAFTPFASECPCNSRRDTPRLLPRANDEVFRLLKNHQPFAYPMPPIRAHERTPLDPRDHFPAVPRWLA